MERFRSYSEYLTEIFSCPVRKISVDAGFTCPNRDGRISSGGCAFCNNDTFTTSFCDRRKSVSAQIEDGISFHSARGRGAEKYLCYFQSYSNTYAPVSHLRELYAEALSVPSVCGLVIATRPDCVDADILDCIASFARDRYVLLEFGIESTCDEALRLCGRGHGYSTSEKAVRMAAERGIRTGAHLIFGLPGESREMMLDGVSRIGSLPLETVKFHQLQIVRGSRYESAYRERPEDFDLFTLDDYIDFSAEAVRRLNPSFVLERFVNEVPPRYLVAPQWGRMKGDALRSMLDRKLEEKCAVQGDLFNFGTQVE